MLTRPGVDDEATLLQHGGARGCDSPRTLSGPSTFLPRMLLPVKMFQKKDLEHFEDIVEEDDESDIGKIENPTAANYKPYNSQTFEILITES